MDEKMKEALEGIYENLTDEQKEKWNACKTSDELMELAGEWGIELPDEMLDAVAGGTYVPFGHIWDRFSDESHATQPTSRKPHEISEIERRFGYLQNM